MHRAFWSRVHSSVLVLEGVTLQSRTAPPPVSRRGEGTGTGALVSSPVVDKASGLPPLCLSLSFLPQNVKVMIMISNWGELSINQCSQKAAARSGHAEVPCPLSASHAPPRRDCPARPSPLLFLRAFCF